MESLNSFRSTLDHLCSARDAVEMIMELGKPLSGVKYCWLEIVEFYGIKSVRFYEVGRFLFLTLIVWLIDFPAFRGSGRISCSMGILAGQLNRLKQVPKSNELGVTINGFLGMMEEVVDFIQKWLKNWMRTYQFIWDGFFTESIVPVKYILVAAQRQLNYGTI